MNRVLMTMLRSTGGRLPGLMLAAIACLLLAAPSLANAQAVERHVPTSAEGRAAPVVAPNAVPADEDDTAIGPELSSLVLIGKGQPLKATAAEGVDVSSVARLAAAPAAIEADLKPFLGRKLSRKLIAELEATIARRYRVLGYPFVSLSTPEQEISGGGLQVRVTEFTAGKVATRGVGKSVARFLLGLIGIKSGDPINAAQLGDDLAWLNRYPYRQVQAVFSPGETPGDTDLVLAATSVKPWQAYAGYDNSGSPSSTYDRYYAGAAVGGVLGRDSVLSAQATGSRDALSGAEHPKYASEAVSYTLPITRRAQIEASIDHIETNQTATAFQVRLKTDEASLGVRIGAPTPFGAASHADVRLGVTAARQEGITLFGGVKVFDVRVDDYALFAGYHLQHQAETSYSVLDIAVHASPGRVSDKNTDAQTRLFSQGRANRAEYAYTTFYFDRTQSLTPRLDWKVQLMGQWSPQALPRTAQGGLGGASLVRGYTLDAGSFDTTVIFRNEIRTQLHSTTLGQISPFAFVDIGQGRDMHLKTSTNLSSIGLGVDAAIGRHAILSVTGASLLQSSGPIHAGDWKAEAAINVRF